MDRWNSQAPQSQAIPLEKSSGARQRLELSKIQPGFKLSVIVPVFNEVKTILEVIHRVRATGLPIELIVVDDGSDDGTRELLAQQATTGDLHVLLHEHNRGKGAALRTGFAHATGNAVVIQDADLEYDPEDLHALVRPILDDQADVVYGTRFDHQNRPVSPIWHSIGNQWITRLANLRTGLKLSDVETCYKMIRRELIQKIAPNLKEDRFGIEIELTIKLVRENARFAEIPIGYSRRGFHEGKKIRLKDAFRAVYCMMRY